MHDHRIPTLALVLCAIAPSPCYSLQLKAKKDAPYDWWTAANGGELPSIWTTSIADGDVKGAIEKMHTKYVFVEFFSPYCPHCMKFAPELERIAEAVYNSKASISMAKVDCIAFPEVCNTYMPKPRLPGRIWGSKSAWLNGNVSDLEPILRLNADHFAHDFAKREGTPLFPQSVDDFHEKWMQLVAPKLGQSLSAREQILTEANTWDLQLGVALLIRNAVKKIQHAHDADTVSIMSGTLGGLVQTLSEIFPEASDSTCRATLRELGLSLVSAVKANWSQDYTIDKIEEQWQFCGTPYNDYAIRGWDACRGSWPGKRGYTCGLWSIFHMIAARVDERKTLITFKTMRGVVKYFFDCADCQGHFFSLPVSESDAETRKKLQLWWWRSHNLVNERVGKEEAENPVGDPLHIKKQWPEVDQCPLCGGTNGEEWNEMEVVKFLHNYYR